MKIDRNDPLNQKDSEDQTFGCRHTNPKICKSLDLENICAFVREDKMCLSPPKSWMKQFGKLKDKTN